MQHPTVFDRQRGDLPITNQRSCCPAFDHHSSKHGPITLTRSQDFHIGVRQPKINDLCCLRQTESFRRQFGIGHNAEEGRHRLPGKSHDLNSGQRLLQPCASLCVMRRAAIVGINENVGVEYDHRYSAPSRYSSNSSTLSKSRGSPRLMGVTTNGFRAGCFEAVSPSRRYRFTTCLNGSPDFRTSLFSKAATSSSRVRVVRTS